MKRSLKVGVVVGLCAIATTISAATALRFGAENNLSRTPVPTEKARILRLAYLHDGIFRKAWLFAYGDGPAGRENLFARHSFDDGATWSAPILLSRDGANAPTGGQIIAARDSLGFVVDNGKPTLYAPPVTSGPMVVVVWNSAYCPQDPAAATAGSYSNPGQGVGDFDGDGSPDRPYHCMWVATTIDPALAAWNVAQLTNGERDAIGEVATGSSAGNAFALAWQEDPAGLQPGEGEGRGDGGMGSHATGGTNIWYTHAPVPNGATFRANVAQLSNNNTVGTGEPGASRPNLQLSGSTAAVVYEETACPGGTGGKCIVYHAFNYAAHDSDAAGHIVSDVTRNSRRARLVLQGASAAGSSPLRAVLLWRESPVIIPAAPADIIVRRGLVDATARPGSTGVLPSDILADVPQNMTHVAASGGNANAHRAIVRGSFIGLAYDLTPSMNGADPEKTATPTANYNLFLALSARSGEAGSWTAPVNLSRVDSPSLTVVEPRLVPTPGTIVNPLTGTPDTGDVQDSSVFYVVYATETNTQIGKAGRVYVSRSTDWGQSIEPFVPVSTALGGQSECQLRPSPDGASAIVVWMGEQAIGDAATKDVMYSSVGAVQLADLGLSAIADAFPAGGQRTVTLSVLNHGTGSARNVIVTGELPNGLSPVGISEPPSCSVGSSTFSCEIPEIASGHGRPISITMSGATEGSYTVNASAVSDYLDADATDNRIAFSLTVTAPPVVPPPAPVPPSLSNVGGGCTSASAGARFDPTLLLVIGLSLIGPALRRARSS